MKDTIHVRFLTEDVDAELIVEMQTIRALGAILEKAQDYMFKGEVKYGDAIVRLNGQTAYEASRSGNENPCIFIAHGSGGSAAAFTELAALLGDRPVYGIEFVDEAIPYTDTIESYAKFVVGGNSNGSK